jgi:hypothetical protein
MNWNGNSSSVTSQPAASRVPDSARD